MRTYRIKDLFHFLVAFYEAQTEEKMWERWIHAHTDMSFDDFRGQFASQRMSDEESRAAIERAEAILGGDYRC